MREDQQEVRSQLGKRCKELGRALGLCSALQDVYGSGSDGPQLLKWWCGWAKRSRPRPFIRLAATIEEHWKGIIAFFNSGYTQGPIETINGLIQLAKRLARGFRNLDYLKAIAYWVTGKLTSISHRFDSLETAKR